MSFWIVFEGNYNNPRHLNVFIGQLYLKSLNEITLGFNRFRLLPFDRVKHVKHINIGKFKIF